MIRGVDGPRTEMVDIERRTNEEIQKLDDEFTEVAHRTSEQVTKIADADGAIQEAVKETSEKRRS